MNINSGYGEYIVFHNEKREVSQDTFNNVYQIFNQYAPATIVNRGEQGTNRFAVIQGKVKEIDPNLEIAFVPRTLYELFYIRKCIKEDLKHQKICPALAPFYYEFDPELFGEDQELFEQIKKSRNAKKLERKCWHLAYFVDAGDNNHAGVKEIAYRLNRTIAKALSPTSQGLTLQELLTHTEKTIEFLKIHLQKGSDEMERLRKGENIPSIGNCNHPGPTTNFGYESSRGMIKPMGIRNNQDAEIIRKAIALECSEVAKKSFLLYRGADSFQEKCDEGDTPYSRSFGTGLFAGCLFDGGATAFHYMRKHASAYALAIPFDQLHSSPFYIPPTNAIAQLCGDGEAFHSRTKGWKDFDLSKIKGMNLGSNSRKRDQLASSLTKDELIAQFERYKASAVLLK